MSNLIFPAFYAQQKGGEKEKEKEKKKKKNKEGRVPYAYLFEKTLVSCYTEKRKNKISKNRMKSYV